MKTNIRRVAVALLALVLCGTAMSSAQQTDPTAAYLQYIAKQLNLTQAQEAQIQTLIEAQRATLLPLLQRMAQNRLAMLNATASGAFDQATVVAITNQQGQIVAQLAAQKALLGSLIYNEVLNADQQAKVDSLRQTQIERINQHLQKLSADDQVGGQPDDIVGGLGGVRPGDSVGILNKVMPGDTSGGISNDSARNAPEDNIGNTAGDIVGGLMPGDSLGTLGGVRPNDTLGTLGGVALGDSVGTLGGAAPADNVGPIAGVRPGDSSGSYGGHSNDSVGSAPADSVGGLPPSQ